jgi:hypothetical protein
MKRFLAFLVVLAGCVKIDPEGYKVYKIKVGDHKSTWKYVTTKKDTLEFKVLFDSSAVYNTIDPINQPDVNKLFGVSDCGEDHLEYSIRIGWRWYKDSLELLWFKHESGEFTFGTIKKIDMDVVHNCTIKIQESNYIIKVDGVLVSLTRSCCEDYKRYYLYPYFGGSEKAPHDITIKIKEK